MRRTILLLAGLALVAAACGSPVEEGSYDDENVPSPSPTATSTLPPCPTGAVSVTADTRTDLTKKPRLLIKNQTCSPPKTIQKIDTVVGTGAAAAEGKTITAHYVGIAWSTRMQFDASWDRNETFTQPLTKGGLIDGWIEGIPGMKVGGRRLLIIPPDKGYGPQGNQGIAPNETLIFVIDLKAVQ